MTTPLSRSTSRPLTTASTTTPQSPAPAAAQAQVDTSTTARPGDTAAVFERPAKGAGAVQAVAASKVATPAQVASQFYEAFQKGDANAMRSLYAPDATFHDPIFSLKGQDAAGKMWAGVFEKGKDSHLSYDVVASDANSVQVKWTADYKLLGRPIHNESLTTMQVKDGKIVDQKDDWSWSKWAKQAFPLGPLVDFPPVKWGLLALIRNA